MLLVARLTSSPFLVVQDNLEQIDIGMRLSGLPDNVAIVAGPRSQREVRVLLIIPRL